MTMHRIVRGAQALFMFFLALFVAPYLMHIAETGAQAAVAGFFGVGCFGLSYVYSRLADELR